MCVELHSVKSLVYVGKKSRYQSIVLPNISGRLNTVFQEADSFEFEKVSQLTNLWGLWIELDLNIGSEILNAIPPIEYLFTSTTGLTHINQNECASRGIGVIGLRDFPDITREISSTSELTWCLTLSVWRKLFLNLAPRGLTSKQFYASREDNLGLQIKGRKIGIVGFGRIGRQLSNFARAFGCQVVAYDPYILKEDIIGMSIELVSDLTVLLRDSDIVIICASQSDDKKKILDKSNIHLLKNESVLVNTARGSLWDEEVIAKALTSGRISGVAVDVFEFEDNRSKTVSPLMEIDEYKYNIVRTKHIGGATSDALDFVTKRMAEKINEILEVKRY